jgi:hypothetical protein
LLEPNFFIAHPPDKHGNGHLHSRDPPPTQTAKGTHEGMTGSSWTFSGWNREGIGSADNQGETLLTPFREWLGCPLGRYRRLGITADRMHPILDTVASVHARSLGVPLAGCVWLLCQLGPFSSPSACTTAPESTRWRRAMYGGASKSGHGTDKFSLISSHRQRKFNLFQFDGRQ